MPFADGAAASLTVMSERTPAELRSRETLQPGDPWKREDEPGSPWKREDEPGKRAY